MVRVAYFFSLLLVGLALGPALAHLFELPNKIGLSAEDYLRVQQNYRGWALLGFIVIPEVIATGVLAFLLRRHAREFGLAVVAFLCVLGAQADFWAFTYPANVATAQWHMLPPNWESLRTQWEYSHATGAVLNLAAFIALILAVLRRRG
jgi:hypothetical protein